MNEAIEAHKKELLELNEQHTAELKLRDKKRHDGYFAYEQ